jgi:hypothetical protein
MAGPNRAAPQIQKSGTRVQFSRLNADMTRSNAGNTGLCLSGPVRTALRSQLINGSQVSDLFGWPGWIRAGDRSI